MNRELSNPCQVQGTLSLFSGDAIYVQIFADRFVVRNTDSGATHAATRSPQSASPRMRIADFTLADPECREAVQAVRRGLRAPELLLHPMERIEGGVSQVEVKLLSEPGLGVGASRLGIHTADPLSGDAVRRAIQEYKA